MAEEWSEEMCEVVLSELERGIEIIGACPVVGIGLP